MCRSARDTDYQEIAAEARELARRLPRKGELSEEKRGELEPVLVRLQKRVGEVAAIDFFHGRAREPVEGLLQEIVERLAPPESKPEEKAGVVEKPRRQTWVTRTGIHV